MKDHLGSIRVVLNSTNSVISAQDYDACLTYSAIAEEVGYPLENRSFSNTNLRYKFTGKEKDKDLENNYDYFGARYYDSRIGRWNGVEPLLEKYFGFTPYCYGLCNPNNLIDIDGNVIIITGDLNYFKQVYNTFKENIIGGGDYVDLLGIIEDQTNFDLIITDILEKKDKEDDDNSGEYAAGVDKITLNHESGKSYKNKFGIRLFDGFFNSGNKYISAMYLEHEFYHLNYYYSKGIKTGSDYVKWRKKNMEEYKKHEREAIQHSREKTKKLFENGKISEEEYNNANSRWDEYEEEINDL